MEGSNEATPAWTPPKPESPTGQARRWPPWDEADQQERKEVENKDRKEKFKPGEMSLVRLRQFLTKGGGAGAPSFRQ